MDGDISLYILFVKHRNNIAIMQKIYSHDLEDTPRITKMFQEYLGLFHIMAEEDPGYR